MSKYTKIKNWYGHFKARRKQVKKYGKRWRGSKL